MNVYATNQCEEMYLEVLTQMYGYDYSENYELIEPVIEQRIKDIYEFKDALDRLGLGYVKFQQRTRSCDAYYKRSLETFIAKMIGDPLIASVIKEKSKYNKFDSKIWISNHNDFRMFKNYLLDLMEYTLDEFSSNKFNKYRVLIHNGDETHALRKIIAPIVRDFVDKVYGKNIVPVKWGATHYFVFKLNYD